MNKAIRWFFGSILIMTSLLAIAEKHFGNPIPLESVSLKSVLFIGIAMGLLAYRESNATR